MLDNVMWAFGRASGVVALVLLTASVVIGIVTRSGRPLPVIPRFSVQLIHRTIALTSTVFVLLHVGTLLLDSYAKLTLSDILVPFLSAAKNPVWVGFGTVALDLLIAVIVTALLRNRIGTRAFKAVHWATYLLWPVSLAHAIGSGTNGTSGWFLVLAGFCTLAVAAAVLWRLTPRFEEAATLQEASRNSLRRPDGGSR
ncbi:ferric reductase-like transmembrane domain-containing protein [Microbacterium rhizosphaerae]|uniref:Ferric reductase-like transmembrane domain-containing protein n=1 Tax=Microbacterium rhizosphaerae TaxID=1678237 RepID=A0ABZ0SNV7_9MICO|nr:ferric reductase-like transmembrane domain-containing protein [Microbacterium rhizosphaerae]WPR88942.1 ferric reductase-like transmembrane domain-containing protein [Microbacterium rhizosphaerae]